MKNEVIKVMIVDDALLQRAVLRQIIEEDPKFKVVATAEDGEQAIRKAKWFDVDVITMDVEMPNKNGLEALQEIMETNPKPIIMLSSLTKKGSKETSKALSLGAVDFIEKPSGEKNFKNLSKEIREKIYNASLTNRENLKKRFDTVKNETFIQPTKVIKKERNKTGVTNLIAIGTSTGGPAALSSILPQLPKDLPAAVVIVQHMPKGNFIHDLANILNNNSAFHVKEAENGEVVQDGYVYIAPGGYHLELFKRSEKLHIVLTQKDYETPFKPSVDVMYASISRLDLTINVFGMILTGMGNDGLKGSGAMRRVGHTILAESKETAVIYGMPRQVIEKGVTNYVLPLERLIPKIVDIINKK